MDYRTVLAARGYKKPLVPELTVKRGGDLVLTSTGFRVVAGKRGRYAGYRPELVE